MGQQGGREKHHNVHYAASEWEKGRGLLAQFKQTGKPTTMIDNLSRLFSKMLTIPDKVGKMIWVQGSRLLGFMQEDRTYNKENSD